MAGNQDGNTIHSVRSRDGPLRSGLVNAAREFVVGNRLAVRNELQFAPDFFLKWGSANRKRQSELTPIPGKIFSEFETELCQPFVLSRHYCAGESFTHRRQI